MRTELTVFRQIKICQNTAPRTSTGWFLMSPEVTHTMGPVCSQQTPIQGVSAGLFSLEACLELNSLRTSRGHSCKRRRYTTFN